MYLHISNKNDFWDFCIEQSYKKYQRFLRERDKVKLDPNFLYKYNEIDACSNFVKWKHIANAECLPYFRLHKLIYKLIYVVIILVLIYTNFAIKGSEAMVVRESYAWFLSLSETKWKSKFGTKIFRRDILLLNVVIEPSLKTLICFLLGSKRTYAFRGFRSLLNSMAKLSALLYGTAISCTTTRISIFRARAKIYQQNSNI